MKVKQTKKPLRIYHPYWKWEDYKAGFYDNCTGDSKSIKKQNAINMFMDKSLTTYNMKKVVDTWFYSCEHNLTNESMNKIAYIGQAACCVYGGVPSTVTMQIWSTLPKEVRDRSDKIALKTLKYYFEEIKTNQLCLSFI